MGASSEIPYPGSFNIDHELTAAFASAMDCLDPFEPNPVLAVAVSGGADSMALAVLATAWASARGGSTHALVVDHGLRPASAAEAKLTINRLTAFGISSHLLPLSGLAQGPAMAERARTMRYQALFQACRELGILHLLLGHHAADQTETLMMRVLRSSQTYGLAGMAALRETGTLRILRPLLKVEPAFLRRFLTVRDLEWVEDPSNYDLRATRSRLRQRLTAGRHGETGMACALSLAGRFRSHEEARAAAELACRVTIRPEGFALLSPGAIGSLALGCLLRTIGAQHYAPSQRQIVELAAKPVPATLAGVRILNAGRFGEGLLFVREEAAVMGGVRAAHNTIWDNRFRLLADGDMPKHAIVEKLGADAACFRYVSDLPSVVLRTLPAVRIGKVLETVPHLGYASSEHGRRMTALFDPPSPIAGAVFVPAR